MIPAIFPGGGTQLDAIFISLTLLMIVVLSGIVGRSLIQVPLPLVQIAFGAVAGLAPQLEIDLQPEVFFLLLVPPLLFIDGWRLPADELVRDRWKILHMAVGLVVATVLAVGSFIAYLSAEAVSASGLFAAVAAGVTMARAEATGAVLGATRIQRRAVWDAVQFVANGIVFVLLGEQLPSILTHAQATVAQSGHHSLWWPLMLIGVTYGAMALVRLAWVWVSLAMSHHVAGGDPIPGWRLVAATTLAGSRGAITFAGILTLPLTLSGEEVFAQRELLILIAMGVIVMSLITAAIGLPLLLRNDAALPLQDLATDHAAEAAAATAALTEIGRISALHVTPEDQAEPYTAAAALVSKRYLQRLEALGHPTDGVPQVPQDMRVVRALQLAAVRAERQSIFQMRRKKAIGAATARRMVRELDLLEAHYEI